MNINQCKEQNKKMYGNTHLSENETYKPGDNGISFFLCVYIYVCKTKTTIKPLSLRQQDKMFTTLKKYQMLSFTCRILNLSFKSSS